VLSHVTIGPDAVVFDKALTQKLAPKDKVSKAVILGTYLPLHTFRLPDRPDYPDCLLTVWSTLYPFQSLVHITRD
jgi:hypothetical protein